MKLGKTDITEQRCRALLQEAGCPEGAHMTLEDFVAVLHRQHALAPPAAQADPEDPATQRAFDRFRGGEPGITPEGLAAVMAELGQPCSDADLEDIFAQADLDGDGLIDAQEFAIFMAGGSAA